MKRSPTPSSEESISQMTPEEMREFEMDFCIAANMQLGLSYEEAKAAAAEWMRDADEYDNGKALDHEIHDGRL